MVGCRSHALHAAALVALTGCSEERRLDDTRIPIPGWSPATQETLWDGSSRDAPGTPRETACVYDQVHALLGVEDDLRSIDVVYTTVDAILDPAPCARDGAFTEGLVIVATDVHPTIGETALVDMLMHVVTKTDAPDTELLRVLEERVEELCP